MRYLHIDKHETLKREVLKTQAKKRVKKRKPAPNLQKQSVAPRPNSMGRKGATLTTAPMPRNRKNPVFPKKKRKWSDFGKGKGGGGTMAKASAGPGQAQHPGKPGKRRSGPERRKDQWPRSRDGIPRKYRRWQT